MKDYITSRIIFGAGAAVTLADFLSLGTVVLGFFGAMFMAASAVYHFNIKKIEKEIKELELKELKKGK